MTLKIIDSSWTDTKLASYVSGIVDKALIAPLRGKLEQKYFIWMLIYILKVNITSTGK